MERKMNPVTQALLAGALALAPEMAIQAAAPRPDATLKRRLAAVAFYNDPNADKCEEQITDPQSGYREIQLPKELCLPGHKVVFDTGPYSATFESTGTKTNPQILNVVPVGNTDLCDGVKLLQDPNVEGKAHTGQGTVATILQGEYPAGNVVVNLPAGTDTLTFTMSRETDGKLSQGNVEWAFKQPLPGCGEQATATPVDTATSLPTETPTSTPTQTAKPSETPMSTPTETSISTSTETSTSMPTNTSTETPTSMPTPTATSAMGPPETANPTETPVTALATAGAPNPSEVVDLPLVSR